MNTSEVDSSRSENANQHARPVPTAFAVMFGLALMVAAYVASPYTTPLFLGATLAVTLGPVFRLLIKLTRGRIGLAAVLTTLLLLIVVVAPLASLVAYGANEVAGGLEWAKKTLEISSLQDLSMGRLPGFMRSMLQRTMSSFNIDGNDLESYGKKALEVAQTAVPRIFGGGLGAVGSLILVSLSTFFFLADGASLIAIIKRLSPLSPKHTDELIEEFQSVASASLLGLAFSAVSQTVVLTLGYWFVGLPHLFFFSVASLVAAFVPLVGAMLVWLPTSLFYGVEHGPYAALGLAAYSFIAINVVDTGLKPLVIQGKMALHGGLLFLSALGGLTVFGPVGFIAGPLCMAFAVAFTRMYQRDYLKLGEDLEKPKD